MYHCHASCSILNRQMDKPRPLNETVYTGQMSGNREVGILWETWVFFIVWDKWLISFLKPPSLMSTLSQSTSMGLLADYAWNLFILSGFAWFAMSSAHYLFMCMPLCQWLIMNLNIWTQHMHSFWFSSWKVSPRLSMCKRLVLAGTNESAFSSESSTKPQ